MTIKQTLRTYLFTIVGVVSCLCTAGLLGNINVPQALALADNGSIILSGDTTRKGLVPKIFLSRILSGGAVDTAFDLAHESFPEIDGWQTARDVIAVADGSIVQAGAAFAGGNIAYLFTKTLSGGLPDPAFGSSGISQILHGAYSKANGLVEVLSGSGLVGVGNIVLDGQAAAGLVLLDASAGAAIDLEALSLGKKPNLNAVVRASATAAVAAAGWTRLPAGKRGLLTQYLVSPTALVPDLSFGLSGSVVSDDILATLYLDLDIDTGGNLVVLGLQGCAPIVRRYSSSGLLDIGFGLSGTVHVPDLVELGLGVDLNMALNALQLQADDRIVLVGATKDQNLLTLRLLADGSAIDSTFSSSGVCVYNSSLASVGTDLAIDLDGNIFIAAPLGCPDNAVFKLNASGMLDLGFGLNGIATQIFTTLSPVVILEERAPSGTPPPSGSPSGSFPLLGGTITRALNTISPAGGNSRVNLNVATSEFTLQPGLYLISAEAPAQSNLNHKISLFDVTNGVTVALGTSLGISLVPIPILEINSVSTLSAVISVTAPTTFRLDHTADNPLALLTTFSGFAASLLGLDEIYARVTIQELAPVCPLQASSQCAMQAT